MSADSLSLLLTGLNILVLLACIAIPWSDGHRRKVAVAVALVGVAFFLANHVFEGYRQGDFSLTVDLASMTIALSLGCYLISYLIELIIRNLLLHGRNDRK